MLKQRLDWRNLNWRNARRLNARRLADRLAPLRRFQRDDGGVAAIEFAFIASTMLVMLVGVVDISNAISKNWRMIQLNRTLADLTSQAKTMDATEANKIFAASAAVLSPHSGAAPTMVITSVVIDKDKVAKVCWSTSNVSGAALAKNSIVTLPNADMAVAKTSLVMTTTKLDHTGLLVPNFEMTAKPLYFRPRRGTAGGVTGAEQVEWTGQAMC
jgi:Flp pilus assembly protein TadG